MRKAGTDESIAVPISPVTSCPIPTVYAVSSDYHENVICALQGSFFLHCILVQVSLFPWRENRISQLLTLTPSESVFFSIFSSVFAQFRTAGLSLRKLGAIELALAKRHALKMMEITSRYGDEWIKFVALSSRLTIRLDRRDRHGSCPRFLRWDIII